MVERILSQLPLKWICRGYNFQDLNLKEHLYFTDSIIFWVKKVSFSDMILYVETPNDATKIKTSQTN